MPVRSEILDLVDVIDGPEIDKLRMRRWLAQPLFQGLVHKQTPILRAMPCRTVIARLLLDGRGNDFRNSDMDGALSPSAGCACILSHT